MKDIIKTLEAAVIAETERAIAERGKFVDVNHALGVMEEELHEANTEQNKLRAYHARYRDSVFDDDVTGLLVNATALKTTAIMAAAELVQVAAMAEKTAMYCTEEMDRLNRIKLFGGTENE